MECHLASWGFMQKWLHKIFPQVAINILAHIPPRKREISGEKGGISVTPGLCLPELSTQYIPAEWKDIKTQATDSVLCPATHSTPPCSSCRQVYRVYLSNTWFTCLPQGCELHEGDNSMQQLPPVLTYIKHSLYAFHLLSHLILTIFWRDKLYCPMLEMRKYRFREVGDLAKVTEAGSNRARMQTEACLAPEPCSPPLWPLHVKNLVSSELSERDTQ